MLREGTTSYCRENIWRHVGGVLAPVETEGSGLGQPLKHFYREEEGEELLRTIGRVQR